MKTNNKISKVDLIIFIISLVVLSVFAYYTLKGDSDMKRLSSEGVSDSAIIIREFAVKGIYFEYIFFVSDKKCNGIFTKNQRNGDISVGDTILVKYLPENPDDANEVVRNKDESVVKVKNTR